MNEHDEDASSRWRQIELKWSLSQLRSDMMWKLDQMERDAQARSEAILCLVVAFGLLIVTLLSR